MKITRCFICYMKERGFLHEDVDCINLDHRLPRKKKKKMKKLMQLGVLDIPLGEEPTSCSMGDDYIAWFREYAVWIKFFEANKSAIQKIKDYSLDIGEGFCIRMHNDKPELFWKWEDDNGLYSYDGDMKAIYQEKYKDDTWSYDETISLIDSLELSRSKVNNFVDLVHEINRKKRS